MNNFSHIGLFEGIGGFSLAARWMGWETIAWCEWDEFCQKVLSYHFPNAKQHGNIKETDFTFYRGQCDIVTGGFPCQPYSAAGKRKGKEDDRHLWPEMLRAIREIQPRWVVGENVAGLLNWNRGMVLDEIKADLEAAGFEVLPPLVLPACAVNAPHRRDRVWIIAHRTDGRCEHGQIYGRGCKEKTRGGEISNKSGGSIKSGDAANTEGLRINRTQEHENNSGQSGERGGCNIDNISEIQGGNVATNTDSSLRYERGVYQTGQQTAERHSGPCNALSNQRNTWHNFPTQSPICSRDDGIPGGLDGITFSKWRNESIKAYGNAIVPQVVFEIFKAIEAFK